MATGEPGYDPALSVQNPTPPVVIDGTGLTTTVPLTVKNAKSESGVELWYTGTTPTGYDLMNASGTLKGGLGIATAANDWITGSAADDIVLHVASGKKLQLGVKAASAPTFSVDANATLGSGAKLLIDSNGSLTSVALQIAGDPNSGIAQLNGADTLSVVLGGTERVAFSTLAALFGVPVRISSSSSLTDVSLQISGDGNTGISQQGGADKLSIVAGGAEMMRFESAGLTSFVGLFMAASQVISADSSTSLATVPIRRAGDVNTGISFPGGADTVSLVAGGVEVVRAGADLVVSPAGALATGATTGFLGIPTCAGAPTGAAANGSLIFDSTNLKLYVRTGGAWKSTVALT